MHHDPAAQHGPGAAALLVGVVLGLVGLAAVAYLAGTRRLRRRGDRWPVGRDAAFAAGCGCLAAAVLVPVPGGEFVVHMAQHLLVGMVAPLLLALGRPVTLALRLAPPGGLRRGLLAVLQLPSVGWLTHPVVATGLSAGGLWVLYRTPLFGAADGRPWLHALVHLHVLVSGLLFTVSVTQLEPLRRRHSLPLRLTVVVLGGAAHNVLAKSLYSGAPPGTAIPGADLRAGAELMYYGGDAVEIALLAVLAVRWYAAEGRELRRAGRRVVSTPRR